MGHIEMHSVVEFWVMRKWFPLPGYSNPHACVSSCFLESSLDLLESADFLRSLYGGEDGEKGDYWAGCCDSR